MAGVDVVIVPFRSSPDVVVALGTWVAHVVAERTGSRLAPRPAATVTLEGVAR